MSLIPLLFATAHADVLINEVLYDAASGKDENTSEWIELCNNGSSSIDLSGWMIEKAGSSWSEAWTFPEGTTIDPGEYYAFGPGVGDKDTFSGLQNGGSETDGIRLVDATGSVQDTVLYDTNNSNKLLDDNNSIKGPFAPDVSAGNTLVRFPNCADKTNDGDDWDESESPSPGAENPDPDKVILKDCPLGEGADVVINEFMANPAGSDGDAEWIELYNAGSASADLSGWILLGGTTPSGTLTEAFPEGTTLAPGEYLIIGGKLSGKTLGEEPDFVDDFSLGNATSSADGIILADCNYLSYDEVVYGGDGGKDKDWGTSDAAPTPADGEAIGRMPNGVDTDSSSSDFAALSFPTPWEANDVIATCDGQDDVKINEFLPNPDSDTTSEDDTREWVELYNNSAAEVDLSGWELQWGTSGYSGSFILPEGTVIGGQSFLVIGGENVAEADVVVPADDDLGMGAASSSPDALRLLHCGPGLADTVIYGPDEGENSDEWTDDSGAVATSWGPKAVAGLTIARRSDGGDTDDSGADFVISATPSPGEPNPEVSCEASADIKINEIFPDPSGSDGGNEWLEIINTGSEDVALDDWSIQTGSSSWATKFSFPPETVLGPGEYLVVADEGVPSEGADVYSSTNLSLGNASTGLDGVRLIDCPGDVADTLLYGKVDAYPADDEEPWADDAGGQSFAYFPDSDLSIARIPDGTDTDDNAADFDTNAPPTPGRANEGGAGGDSGGGGGDGGAGGGCNDKEPAAPGEEGCSVSPIVSSPLWVLFLFGGLRRRQRGA